MLESEICTESLIGMAVDEVHCVTELGTSSNNKNCSAFRVWYSHDSCNFNYARRFTSSVRNFWPRIADISLRVSQVVAGANGRRLYSQAYLLLTGILFHFSLSL